MPGRPQILPICSSDKDLPATGAVAASIAAANAEAIARACAHLAAGELVAIPTETVYGLAADAENGDAVALVFKAKGRPRFNPLICHADSLAMAERHGVFDARARRLAREFWPGPLTLILPKKPGSPVHDLVSAGLATIGLRVPAGPVRDLIAAFGQVVAAPSANLSGRMSPTRAEHVALQLGGDVALILDAGPAQIGVESTIVALDRRQARLLRPGGLASQAIEAVLGEKLQRVASGDKVEAPGMLASHYAPQTPLRLNASKVRPGEALLAFGPDLPEGADTAILLRNLSPTGDLSQAAANFFQALHELDAAGAETIAAMPIPDHGLGEAINDRLARAAGPSGRWPSGKSGTETGKD
ncbi:MAG: threonylcarbamoyl-AMP synthase [Alphaproteobacteria bacterium]|nr:MAG: threonylcarbamoyl-AMP synthase [Alphaproteobacteria bacterium]